MLLTQLLTVEDITQGRTETTHRHMSLQNGGIIGYSRTHRGYSKKTDMLLTET